MARRITRALAGQAVVFHGYDGRDYSAHVAKVRKGVAVVRYTVAVRGITGEVVAYITDSARLKAVR